MQEMIKLACGQTDRPFWERRQPPTGLKTAGLKGERHIRLNLRLDQKECNLGLGMQQSLAAQQPGFGGEDPRHQIASAGAADELTEWDKAQGGMAIWGCVFRSGPPRLGLCLGKHGRRWAQAAAAAAAVAARGHYRHGELSLLRRVMG
ncbi:hypothetical protein EYF80_009521 [Liparis tanakae]|uniref:Uncharacterized protein n=1 Tax=Liparis tanakae TaxID=230148 RepID=A0A4Z2IQQ7_9TELE|nr:hypothetical protein EYF80_009521 [Liparis tanakae]